MECSVSSVVVPGDLSSPVLPDFTRYLLILFDFALTFTARRFNLREHLDR